VICGAQAAVMATGQGNSTDKPNWVRAAFRLRQPARRGRRHDRGLKKTVFNSADFGTIVLSSYAAAP
jgi:hypothetical protein